MTPQERELVSGLFDRLAQLESQPRDADAERAIAAGLSRAPNAIYPLVQTVLLQDEALRQAEARIRELEGGGAPAGSGFLDNMRNALFPPRGGTSVPTVRPGVAAEQPSAATAGNSFLGTAAASAVGVIGGAMMFNMISSMFGNRGQAFASPLPSDQSPWSGNSAGGDLAREAGLNEIGRGGDDRRAGLFGASDDFNGAGGDADAFDGDFGGDAGGDFGGGD